MMKRTTPICNQNHAPQATSILPQNPNDYRYLLPATTGYLLDVAYGPYRFTVAPQTMRQARRLASAAIRSHGMPEPVSFTTSTDDAPAMLMVLHAAMLSRDARLTLSFAPCAGTPMPVVTGPQDARTYSYRRSQETMNRSQLDVFTMRGRLVQAGGAR